MAVSIDISNAFNTIPWDVINEEFERRKFPLSIRAIINSYLRNRTISYVTKERNKEKRAISGGVLQGSVLGPVLWNIAYDRILSRSIYRDCNLICYADDTLLLAKAENKEWAIGCAEIGTNILVSRIEKMGLKVTIEKTEAIIFGPGKDGHKAELNVGGKTIQTKSHIKYLGVMIDEKLDMREHLNM